MLFYCGKRSAGICIVLGPKKSSTYCREYASGFLEPAAVHLPAALSPRNEASLGETPSRLLNLFIWSVWSIRSVSCVWFNETNQINQTDRARGPLQAGGLVGPVGGEAVAYTAPPVREDSIERFSPSLQQVVPAWLSPAQTQDGHLVGPTVASA